MSLKRMRPTFHVLVPLAPEAVLTRVRAAMASPECQVTGSLGRHGFEIKVKPEHEHLWSPWLTVEVQAHASGSELFARFSPKPEVWTFILALYALCTFGAIASLMWGISQATLGGSLQALWGLPAAMLGALAVYLAGFVGQGLGGAQMYVLRRFLDLTLPMPGGEPGPLQTSP